MELIEFDSSPQKGERFRFDVIVLRFNSFLTKLLNEGHTVKIKAAPAALGYLRLSPYFIAAFSGQPDSICGIPIYRDKENTIPVSEAFDLIDESDKITHTVYISNL